VKKIKIVAMLSVLVLTGCGSQVARTESSKPITPGQASPAPAGGTFLHEKIPTKVLNLPLIDAAGRGFTLGSLAGQIVVISNFLTSCQEICPMTTANMRDIADAVSKTSLKAKVKVLEVTLDAGLDTPKRLTAYQALFGEKSWTMATSSAKSLNDFWTYFGAPGNKEEITAKEASSAPLDWQSGKPVRYDFVHSDLILIVGKDSYLDWLNLGAPKMQNQNIPTKLKEFLSKVGKQNLLAPEEPTWSISSVFGALTHLSGVKISG
jgi:cytochrome oxidase Cu insertion factor (SCO1/SenC/PrrC family)